MYQPLVPCPACDRHVRASEAACPFCASALSDLSAKIVPGSTARISRAAAFVFTTSLAVAGCGSDVGGGTGGTGGASSSATSGGEGGAGGDGGGAVALYGAPAPDGGEGGGPVDDGGGSADYGAPPPQDAG